MSAGTWLTGVCVSWLIGIALHLQQASLPSDMLHGAVLAIGVAAIFVGWRWRRLAVVAWIAVAMLGFGVAGWHASQLLRDAMPAALEGDDVIVVGVIAAMPQATEGGVRFRFDVERASRLGMPGRPEQAVHVPSRLALGWYRGFREDDVQAYPPPPDLTAGQRWQFTLRLRRPHGNLNPHGFDYELWLFEQGLRATGYVRAGGARAPRLMNAASGYFIERARQSVRDAILRHVPDARAAGVLAALAVGDQAAIGRQDWDVFRNAGVAHLMSISGLHVTMFAWLAGAAIATGWRRGGWLALRIPTPTASRWGGVAAAFAYALFSGWGVPAQRTVCMLMIAALLQSIGRRWPWPLVLLTAAAVVAALDPWALLQPGFWLSFMAVGLLMSTASGGLDAKRGGDNGAAEIDVTDYPLISNASTNTASVNTPSINGTSVIATSSSTTPMNGTSTIATSSSATSINTRPTSTTPTSTTPTSTTPRSALAQHAAVVARRWLAKVRVAASSALRTQFVATIGLTPLTLVFFQQVSLVGLAANLIAIPLVTLVITPLALLGVAMPMLWTAGAAIVQLMSVALTWLASLPWAVWSSGASPVWAQWAGLFGALLLLMPLPWRVRALSVPFVLPLMLPVSRVPAEGAFDVVAADVGQGTAVLVRTRSHLLVYDTGPQYSPDNDAGQRVLVPLLKARGEPRVDKLVLSHRDTDHVGGAASLLSSMPTDSMLSSLEPDHPLMRHASLQGKPNERCDAGQSWTWDGVRFDVLHPALADYAIKTGGANGLSCVVLVTGSLAAGPTAVTAMPPTLLLAGDIEAEQERRLVAGYGDRLQSAVLMAPHHGSRTSSTQLLLDAVNPTIAVVQAGYLNRFGHPAPDVVERYEASGTVVYGSTECGAWTWRGAAPECQRTLDRRYWHWQADPSARPTGVR